MEQAHVRESRAETGGVRAISLGGGEWYVSAAEVADVLRSRRPAADLDDGVLRVALAVAHALSEVVRAATRGADAPWEKDVREDVDDLARRSGASEAEATAALDLLSQAGVVHRVPQRGEPRLRLPETVFRPQPLLAGVDWEAVREALNAWDGAGSSIMAAQAVLRELASRAHARTALGSAPWVRESLAPLAESTGYQRAATMSALRALEQIGAIEADRPSGRTAAYRILPGAFGEAALQLPAAVPAAPAEGRGSPDSAASSAGAELAYLARINGAELRIRRGATLEVPPGWQVVLGESDGVPTLEVTPPRS